MNTIFVPKLLLYMNGNTFSPCICDKKRSRKAEHVLVRRLDLTKNK